MTSPSWPALASEPQTWTPSSQSPWGPGSDYSGTPMTYRSAVPSPVATLTPTPSPEVSALAAEAERELWRLDADLGPRVSSFAPVLLRSEAASSSQIENLTASAQAIFSAELGARTGQNAEQIAANTRALQAAIELSQEISPQAVQQMHSVLMANQPRHLPGQWRDEAVWVGTRSDSPVGAEYVAPHHSRVPELMKDVADFVITSRAPALIVVAVAHAQFETIHPFTDGNGRVGRALAQATLRHRGVTRNLAVPVSAGLLADVSGYHGALMAYREGNLDPIVTAFVQASNRAVANTRQLAADIDAIRSDWNSRLTARRDSNAWRLLDILTRRPVLNSAAASQELGVQQPNVYPPLRTLVDAGIVKSKNEHQLGPFWRSDEILSAIDAFAQRAGRRERS